MGTQTALFREKKFRKMSFSCGNLFPLLPPFRPYPSHFGKKISLLGPRCFQNEEAAFLYSTETLVQNSTGMEVPAGF